jgi:hypothetical protein
MMYTTYQNRIFNLRTNLRFPDTLETTPSDERSIRMPAALNTDVKMTETQVDGPKMSFSNPSVHRVLDGTMLETGHTIRQDT